MLDIVVVVGGWCVGVAGEGGMRIGLLMLRMLEDWRMKIEVLMMFGCLRNNNGKAEVVGVYERSLDDATSLFADTSAPSHG